MVTPTAPQPGEQAETPELLRHLLSLPNGQHVHVVRSTSTATLYRAGHYAVRVNDTPEPHLAHRASHLHQLGLPTPDVQHSGPLGHRWITVTTWHNPTRTPHWQQVSTNLNKLHDSTLSNLHDLNRTLIEPKLTAAAQHIPTAPNTLIRVLADRHDILNSARNRYGTGTLHGDLHHGNLLGTTETTYMIDLEHMSHDTLAWDLVPAASRGRRFDGNWQPYHTLASTWQRNPLHDPEFARLCLLREALITLSSLARAATHPHDTSLTRQAEQRTRTWHGQHKPWSAW